MSQIEDLPFLNAAILCADGGVVNSLTEKLANAYPDSNIFSFSEIDELKEQLVSKKHHFLVIDLQNTKKEIVEFISFCKKKYRKLVIIVVANSGDIILVKDFFEIGINAFVSAEITEYEFKIALEKTFSGENYVGTDVSGKLISNFLKERKITSNDK